MIDNSCNKFAAIVPCYNVGDACAEVIVGLKDCGCAVIAVDDGSVDGTGEVLKGLDVAVLSHEINRGKGAALRTGLQYFLEKGDWAYAATVDSDGQHDPREIPRMMEALANEPADLLIGSRQFEFSKMPFKRWIANKVSSFVISKCLRTNVKDIQSGFRVYSRKLIETIYPQVRASGFEIETELLVLALRSGAAVREIPIQAIYSERSNSTSSWRAYHDSVRIAKTIWPYLFKK